MFWVEKVPDPGGFRVHVFTRTFCHSGICKGVNEVRCLLTSVRLDTVRDRTRTMCVVGCPTSFSTSTSGTTCSVRPSTLSVCLQTVHSPATTSMCWYTPTPCPPDTLHVYGLGPPTPLGRHRMGFPWSSI